MAILGLINGDQTWIGMIDDVVMAECALGEDEIQAYMDQAPVVNLHLDEGLENVLQTITSFGDDGPGRFNATCDSGAGECPMAGSRGQMREAPIFDGDDLLSVPDDDALDLSTFSLGLWVKPDQEKGDYQPLVVKEASDGTARNYGLFVKPDSMQVHYSLQQSDCATWVSGDSAGFLNQDQWNHVMMTLDGAAARIYLNGTLQSSTAYAGTPCLNDHPLKIGNETGAYTGFEGVLDEVTLHTVALNAREVQALYAYQASWYDTTSHDQIFVDAESPHVDAGESPVFMDQQTRLLSLSAYDLDSGLQSVTVQITDPALHVTSQGAISSTEPTASVTAVPIPSTSTSTTPPRA